MKKIGFAAKNTELSTETLKKSHFLYYEYALWNVFLVYPDEIRYQSRATQRALTHQISS